MCKELKFLTVQRLCTQGKYFTMKVVTFTKSKTGGLQIKQNISKDKISVPQQTICTLSAKQPKILNNNKRNIHIQMLTTFNICNPIKKCVQKLNVKHGRNLKFKDVIH